jgi:endonuclease III-like uncharacterized protein
MSEGEGNETGEEAPTAVYDCMLYETLKAKHGSRADPDTWWPIYYGRSVPPEFERAITNILVQNSRWRAVRQAVDALDSGGLLTASALAEAPVEAIAGCIRPTGLQTQKAQRLQALARCVVEQFGSESAFCAGATRDALLGIEGTGEETADRTLLFVCGCLEWPVDAYCFRVLAHHGAIAGVPVTAAEKKGLAAEIKGMVERAIPHQLADWQRLHALVQLEGEAIRTRNNRSDRSECERSE